MSLGSCEPRCSPRFLRRDVGTSFPEEGAGLKPKPPSQGPPAHPGPAQGAWLPSPGEDAASLCAGPAPRGSGGEAQLSGPPGICSCQGADMIGPTATSQGNSLCRTKTVREGRRPWTKPGPNAPSFSELWAHSLVHFFLHLVPVQLPPAPVQPEETDRRADRQATAGSVQVSNCVQGINILRPNNGADPPPTPAAGHNRYR